MSNYDMDITSDAYTTLDMDLVSLNSEELNEPGENADKLCFVDDSGNHIEISTGSSFTPQAIMYGSTVKMNPSDLRSVESVINSKQDELVIGRGLTLTGSTLSADVTTDILNSKAPTSGEYSNGSLSFRKNDGGSLFSVDISSLKTKSPLSGKKIGIIGDSMTDDLGQGTFWKMLQDRVDDLSFVVDAVSGSKLVDFTTSKMTTDCDFICVCGGWNDWYQGITLGSLGNTTAGTFYGSVYRLATSLLTNFPDSIIFFLTEPARCGLGWETNNYPWYEYPKDANGVKFEAFETAIVDTCYHLGIPVMDFYRNSCLNSYYNKTKYIEETSSYGNKYYLHGNSEGARIISYLFENELLRFLPSGLN